MYSALVYHDVAEGQPASSVTSSWEHKLKARNLDEAATESQPLCAKPGDVVEVWVDGTLCVGGWSWNYGYGVAEWDAAMEGM